MAWAASIAGVAVRPWLWGEAVAAAARMTRRRWWRHPPFLPLPDRKYLGFRLETQYGAAGVPSARDLRTYLGWCRSQRAIVRRARP
jgi:hypothetical protein